ncbi:DUF3789 domain-containing protein [uncultured Draconibacterium sp.]
MRYNGKETGVITMCLIIAAKFLLPNFSPVCCDYDLSHR